MKLFTSLILCITLVIVGLSYSNAAKAEEQKNVGQEMVIFFL